MANKNEALYKIFSANLSKSSAALHCLQRLNLSDNIGVGYNGQGWEYLPQCVMFPLRKQDDTIVGFYGYPIDRSNQEPAYAPRRTGFYPRYPDAYTERLLLTDSVVSAAYLWQIPQIWEKYTVLASYDSKGLTKEQRIAIASLQKLREVTLFFSGNSSGQVLAGRVREHLSDLASNVVVYQVDAPEETINDLGGSKCLDLVNGRYVFSSKAEEQPQVSAPKEDTRLHDLVESLKTDPPVADSDTKPKVKHPTMQDLRPNLDQISLEWIDEQQQRYGLSDYELSLQLGQVTHYMYQIRASKIKISKGIKAAIWHLFQRLELTKYNK